MTSRETIRTAQLLIKDYAAAKERAASPLRVLWELDSLLYKGRTYLHAWEEIERTTRGPDGEILATALQHFCVCGAALLVASSLDATKLLETQGSSVHMDYFLNLVENEGKRVLNDKWTEVHQTIAGDRCVLEALREQSKAVRNLRDQRLAHLDRNVLSGSRLNDRAAADAGLLRNLFDRIDGILQNYTPLRETFQYMPPPELESAFPGLFTPGSGGVEPTFGPDHLRDLLDLARLGWNTLPDRDPVVSRSAALHERLWRISRMVKEEQVASNRVAGSD
ncbi:MAG: hypothetical protein ACI9VS_003816 [Candidatus Binatia bacterium]|jgi:hypothetical protein